MNARRTLTSLLLAASVTCIAAPPAWAQSDADRATARALGQEGHDALDRKDWATAADRFSRADSLIHAPTFLLGLAQAQIGLDKWVSAQENLNRITRDGLAAGAPPAFTKALEQAKKELAALAPRIPTVTIQVKGAPAARVTIDGSDVPAAALGVKRPVDPGKHVVRATADGFAPAQVIVLSGEGKGQEVTLELVAGAVTPPVAPPVAPPTPVLDKPPPAPPPAANKPPDAPAPPPAAPPSPPDAGSSMSGQKIGGIVALSVGGAGLVVGAIMGVVAIGKHGQLVDECVPAPRCPAGSQDHISLFRTAGGVSTVGFIAGGAGVVTGIILLATAPKAKKEASLVPVLGPGYAGFSGRF